MSSENKHLGGTNLDRLRAILRRKYPVWRDDTLGNFVLTRHDDVRTVLADRSLLKDPAKAAAESLMMQAIQSAQPEGLIYRTAGDSILKMDEPRHSRIRTPRVGTMARGDGDELALDWDLEIGDDPVCGFCVGLQSQNHD